ncbi:cupin domain-containing protein [Paenibacillus eucommiae]|uniref:Quercetin dioxygenase-like cupin family protein n=1 Tax=Paenibacillus eucommiae TaxID=1355755 RepID=A0ABS4J6D7_9BACL|nr:cupin domain-containing protein [Paenibacillus eucommiae]MBP1995393.1 quercetin dioxygenase-like cupin family protein [Paenibacillus eucommiae]
MKVANWTAMEEVFVREGVTRKGFTGEGATLALHTLQPGHEPKPHSHAYEQIVYILSGKVKFHIEDNFTILEEGGLLVVPPNVMHYAEVLGDEPVLNLDVFTPKRAEYDEQG